MRVPASSGVAPASTAGLIPWAQSREQLVSAHNYWLATVRPDGRPHVMPLWAVWLDDRLYFATDPTSRKGRNLTTQPCVSLHLESGDDVVILEGRAEVVDDPKLLARIADVYEAKYAYRPGAEGFHGVRPHLAFAWRERDFPASATRYAFDPA